MAQQRASIVAHALDDVHVPLTPARERRTPVEASGWVQEVPKPAEPISEDQLWGDGPRRPVALPSVAKASAKDRLVSYSVRLRLSQVERLEELKEKRGIVPSELVRDFIDLGFTQL